jgi:hypothetical protein
MLKRAHTKEHFSRLPYSTALLAPRPSSRALNPRRSQNRRHSAGAVKVQTWPESVLQFFTGDYSAFQDTPVDSLRPNWWVLGIAPSQGNLPAVRGQAPWVCVRPRRREDGFRYEDWFPKEPNVGYETLIHDVMIGDQTLFMRADMVEQAWRIV